jgi:Flp pilus assembly protein TadD
VRLRKSKFGGFLLVIGLTAASVLPASAGDLRITLPKRTDATPVQKLNREGVQAVQKHQLRKAEKLFYKAYLIDPDDPFTLNNLGYISEVQGRVERAQRYYELASRQNSETTVDKASVSALKGRPLSEVTVSYANRDLRINRGNIEAMSLLNQGRVQEAEEILRRTLALDPKSPFTLNNLGYAMEAEGNLDSALRYYTQAADSHSSESVVVAIDPRWRGKPISEVAANNVRALRKRIDTEQTVEAKVARFNLQGVSALNHNDPQQARRFFEEAYKLDPRNAFALNNMGYVAEMDGDQETADEFYTAAKTAEGSRERVALASRSVMRGQPLGQVAQSNDEGAQANLEARREIRQRQSGPIQLRTRDNKPVPEPETTPLNSETSPPPNQEKPPQANPEPPQQNPAAPPNSQPPQ